MTDGVAIVVASSSCLSILGSAFIVVSYALWPRIRTKSRIWLVCLSFADFAGAAGYGASAFSQLLVSPHFSREQKFSCQFQSVVTTWSSIATFCWTVALAVHLYVSIVRDGLHSARKLFPAHAFVCFAIPTAVVVWAVYSDALGYAGAFTTSGWCWISEKPKYPVFGGADGKKRHEHARLFWMLVAGKFWEISSCVIIFVLYFLIRRHLQLLDKNDQFLTSKSKMAVGKADRKMIVIPLAFLFLRVWGTTRFIIDVVVVPDHRHEPPGYRPLMYFQAFGDTAQGFVNFFIFCWNTETVRRHMRAAVCCESGPLGVATESTSLLRGRHGHTSSSGIGAHGSVSCSKKDTMPPTPVHSNGNSNGERCEQDALLESSCSQAPPSTQHSTVNDT